MPCLITYWNLHDLEVCCQEVVVDKVSDPMWHLYICKSIAVIKIADLQFLTLDRLCQNLVLHHMELINSFQQVYVFYELEPDILCPWAPIRSTLGTHVH